MSQCSKCACRSRGKDVGMFCRIFACEIASSAIFAHLGSILQYKIISLFCSYDIQIAFPDSYCNMYMLLGVEIVVKSQNSTIFIQLK